MLNRCLNSMVLATCGYYETDAHESLSSVAAEQPSLDTTMFVGLHSGGNEVAEHLVHHSRSPSLQGLQVFFETTYELS